MTNKKTKPQWDQRSPRPIWKETWPPWEANENNNRNLELAARGNLTVPTIKSNQVAWLVPCYDPETLQQLIPRRVYYRLNKLHDDISFFQRISTLYSKFSYYLLFFKIKIMFNRGWNTLKIKRSTFIFYLFFFFAFSLFQPRLNIISLLNLKNKSIIWK